MGKRKPKAFKFGKGVDLAEKIGSGLKQIFIMAASHPATAGLAVMATASGLKLILAPKEGSRVSGELTGIYNGAQAIAAGAVLAPVVIGALSLASDVAKGSYGRTYLPPPTE